MHVQIHSYSPVVDPPGCEVVIGSVGPRLRGHAAGYSGFRAGATAARARRILPLNFTAVIVDFAGTAPLVTGPRSTGLLYDRPGWRYGVTVGLTPAGTSALFGVPARELTGRIVPLGDLLGWRAEHLVEQLAAQPDWPARFAALDRWLTAELVPDPVLDPALTRAWWRLQHPGPSGRITVAAVARELGVSQRYLQLGFGTQIGLAPKTVARVARFQRAVWTLSTPAATIAAAAARGYADQSHFHRETRTLAGVTPAELFASVQDALVPRL